MKNPSTPKVEFPPGSIVVHPNFKLRVTGVYLVVAAACALVAVWSTVTLFLPGIVAGVLLAWLPAYECVSTVPKFNSVFFTEDELGVLSLTGFKTVRWADVDEAALIAERRTVPGRVTLSQLVFAVRKDDGRHRLVRVNLRRYFGSEPEGWGEDLVNILDYRGIELPEPHADVLCRLGGPVERPTKLSRRQQRKKARRLAEDIPTGPRPKAQPSAPDSPPNADSPEGGVPFWLQGDPEP